MTTIACNRRVIAADSCLTHQDIGIGTGQFPTQKLHRIGRSIFGERGEDMAGIALALDWLRKGAKYSKRPEIPDDADWYLLELAPEGIYLWDTTLTRDPVKEPNFAIGSGAKAALYCMRFLKMSPLRAVEEASRVDAFTRAPFVVETLRGR